MVVNMTMEVTLTLPDGSASMDTTGGRGWVLPNGDWVKVLTMLELNVDRMEDLPEELGIMVVEAKAAIVKAKGEA